MARTIVTIGRATRTRTLGADFDFEFAVVNDLGHLADQPTGRGDRVAAPDVLDQVGLILGPLLLRTKHHEVHDEDNGAEQRQILDDGFVSARRRACGLGEGRRDENGRAPDVC